MADPRFTIRMAARALRASPAVSLLAIVCIGLGIGSVTTVYSTASAFTFHPLPQITDPGRLLFVADAPASAPERGQSVAPGTFADIDRLPEFSATSVSSVFTANIAGDDLPERAAAWKVSVGFFSTVGRTPQIGRAFVEAEMVPGADRVAILSHGLWQRRFGGDSGVVNRSVRINGEAWTIVGVMPDDFVFPPGTQLWAPLAFTPAEAADRTSRDLFMMARMAPGVSLERAEAAVSALGAQLDQTWPAAYRDRVLRVREAEAEYGDGPRPFMGVMLGTVAFLLLIVCANVANLLLARATGRRRETGVRIALGASRAQLVMQHLTESMLLALAGGALGVLIAWWGVSVTGTTVPVEVQQFIPGFGAIRLDWRAFVVAAGASMAAGLLFGLAPALASSSVDVVTSLKDAGRGESRHSKLRGVRSTLVVGEMAMALMLVAGAALMASTSRRLSVAYPGFRTEQVLTAKVTLPDADYPSDSSVMRFWNRLRDETATLPGVDAAELATSLPMSWEDQRAQFYAENERPERPDDQPSAGLRRVSHGYLQSLDVPLVAGRFFSAADAQDTPGVAIVSERAAQRFFPRGDAIGRRLVLRDRPFEVVGIVRDVRANPLTSAEPSDVVYLPLAQSIARTTFVVIRARQDPTSLAAGLQATVGRLDVRLAAGDVAPMQRVVAAATAPQSATAQMLMASAFIALVLAAVGTYGVMSYVVGRRTHEMGLRVALGASQGDVIGLIVGSVARLTLVGVVLGVLGALALGQGMKAILVDTSPSDPMVIGGAAVLLAAIALAAGYFPARRAARVSPLVALRSD